ncbi:MAG: hypothetical protein RKK15_09855 [Defluviicoccus sp.]|nr:hypothetical protein [Defluviicoccus sp.]
MAIESTFFELREGHERLMEGLKALRTTVIEDKPLYGDVVLVDDLGNAVDDLLGWLEEGLATVRDAQAAVAHPSDLARAAGSLGKAHDRLLLLLRRFFGETIAYRRLNALAQFGAARGGEWQAWLEVVFAALRQCEESLLDMQDSFLRCWQDLTERLPATPCHPNEGEKDVAGQKRQARTDRAGPSSSGQARAQTTRSTSRA